MSLSSLQRFYEKNHVHGVALVPVTRILPSFVHANTTVIATVSKEDTAGHATTSAYSRHTEMRKRETEIREREGERGREKEREREGERGGGGGREGGGEGEGEGERGVPQWIQPAC